MGASGEATTLAGGFFLAAPPSRRRRLPVGVHSNAVGRCSAESFCASFSRPPSSRGNNGRISAFGQQQSRRRRPSGVSPLPTTVLCRIHHSKLLWSLKSGQSFRPLCLFPLRKASVALQSESPVEPKSSSPCALLERREEVLYCGDVMQAACETQSASPGLRTAVASCVASWPMGEFFRRWQNGGVQVPSPLEENFDGCLPPARPALPADAFSAPPQAAVSVSASPPQEEETTAPPQLSCFPFEAEAHSRQQAMPLSSGEPQGFASPRVGFGSEGGGSRSAEWDLQQAQTASAPASSVCAAVCEEFPPTQCVPGSPTQPAPGCANPLAMIAYLQAFPNLGEVLRMAAPSRYTE